jgi:diaminohydroxyphosphoribosylaminopyrimidine deaminase/5-amino-6-(5-phosphoribosylamino)uracil reductase
MQNTDIQNFSEADTLFMRRALQLAALGKGNVSPNPMVGCVIVANDQIIGEGWHEEYGKAHAEVNAIKAVADKNLLREATVYVSLEPCAHFGKTPPCADLLVESGVREVVVCNEDPFSLVAGKGLEKLRAAGILVRTGLLAAEGRHLNRRFFTFVEKQRPYIILKWAQTPDGFLARKNYDSRWISNPLARKWVHKWRTENDAIMVGTQTALHDNPRLNARGWQGNRQPTRIVLDANHRLLRDLHLFDGSQKTLVLCQQMPANPLPLAEYLLLENISAQEIVKKLYQAKIQSLIVEGGQKLLQTFIEENCWDEARIFVGNQCFGEGIAAPILSCLPHSKENVNENQFYVYKNARV